MPFLAHIKKPFLTNYKQVTGKLFSYYSNSIVFMFSKYFQATNWVRTTFGETLVLLLIGLGGLVLAGLLSYASGARRVAASSTFNGCLGHTSQFEVP